eukprot:scaffold14574_cov120-Isochrysis_galbana.AAC.6
MSAPALTNSATRCSGSTTPSLTSNTVSGKWPRSELITGAPNEILGTIRPSCTLNSWPKQKKSAFATDGDTTTRPSFRAARSESTRPGGPIRTTDETRGEQRSTRIPVSHIADPTASTVVER